MRISEWSSVQFSLGLLKFNTFSYGRATVLNITHQKATLCTISEVAVMKARLCESVCVSVYVCVCVRFQAKWLVIYGGQKLTIRRFFLFTYKHICISKCKTKYFYRKYRFVFTFRKSRKTESFCRIFLWFISFYLINFLFPTVSLCRRIKLVNIFW